MSATDEKSPWITITVAGCTAGLMVAAVTYAATANVSSAAATTTGFTIETLGEIASLGVRSILGEVAGLSVKIVSRGVAQTSEATMRHSGQITAAAAAAVAGATTALTITVGTRIIEYSIEYGGIITSELAQKFSEAYLAYKAKHTPFIDNGDISELDDNDWIVVNIEPVEIELESFRPVGICN